MFPGKEIHINRLKGQIISVINQAIREKDSTKLNELSGLINKLAMTIAADEVAI